MTLALGVLASGSGTNLQAILDAVADGRLDAEVRSVVCNVPGARALERAAAAGVPHACIDHRQFDGRAAFERALSAELRARGVEWVALAGFMRLLTPTFLAAYPGRILNIHPSLLPDFPGMHAHRQALAARVRESGCTIHLVDDGTDTGPVLAQAVVPVLPDDDESSLADRIHREEHRLYPLVLQWIAEGRLEGDALVGVSPPDASIRIPRRVEARA